MRYHSVPFFDKCGVMGNCVRNKTARIYTAASSKIHNESLSGTSSVGAMLHELNWEEKKQSDW